MDPGRQVQIAGSFTAPAEKKEQGTGLRVENLDILKGCIHNIQVSISVYVKPFGSGECTERISKVTVGFQKLAVRVKFLHSEVEGIGDIDAALMVRNHVGRFGELACGLPPFSDGPLRFAGSFIQSEYLVLVYVTYIYGVFIDGHIHRLVKEVRSAIRPQKLVVRAKDDNLF